MQTFSLKNTIAERIQDFLKNYPPFNLLSNADLFSICQQVEVIYLEKGKPVFKEGETAHKMFYITNKGAVTLTQTENNKDEIMDICDEGDIFGLRTLVLKERYIVNAITNEESIIYGIPSDIFEPYIE